MMWMVRMTWMLGDDEDDEDDGDGEEPASLS